MIDYHVIHIFYIFLLPLSSIVYSGFHPILLYMVCKNVSIRAKDFLFEVKTVFYSVGMCEIGVFIGGTLLTLQEWIIPWELSFRSSHEFLPLKY